MNRCEQGKIMGRVSSLIEKDKEKAIALVQSGFTQAKVGSMFNVSAYVIGRVVKEYKESQVVPVDAEVMPSDKPNNLPTKSQNITAIKERFADKFTQSVDRIVDSITDTDLEKANLQQKAVSAGIFFDKVALIRSINQTVDHKHTLVGAIRRSTAEQD